MIASRSFVSVALVCLAFLLGGCSMGGAFSPSTSTRQSRPSPLHTLAGLGAAILAEKDTQAVLYFTPQLRARAAATSASAMLGVSSPPASYRYKVNSRTGKTGMATMTFTFQRGAVTNRLGLVNNNGQWQVSSIVRK